MEALLAGSEGEVIIDKVLAEINAVREAQGASTILNAFGEASNDSVYHATLTLSQISDELDMEPAILEAMREMLSAESSSPRSEDTVLGPQQANNRRVLLDKSATHVDLFINGRQGEGGELSLRLEVYNKYLELSGVGPVIDGDLVVQGTLLNPQYGPAICKVDFAADHEESLSEAALIAPWLMMHSPAAGPEQAAEFAVPISLGVEHREGHVRVRIYVEHIEAIPYGEEQEAYLQAFRDDTQGERFVCAIDFTTRATTSGEEGGPASLDGLSMGFELGLGDAGMEKGVDVGDQSPAQAVGGGKARMPRRAPAERGSPSQPSVVDVKVAIGFDEVEALRAEGFQLSCQHLGEGGVHAEDEEGKWSYFLMAKYADVSAAATSAGAGMGAAGTEVSPETEAGADAEMQSGDAAAETKGEGKMEEETKEETKEPAAAEDGGGEAKEPGNDGDEAPLELAEAPAAAADAPVSSEAFVLADLYYLQVPRDAVAAAEGQDLAGALAQQGLLPKGYSLLPQDLLATGPGADGAPDTCIFVAFKLCPAAQAAERIVSLGMFSCAQELEHSELPEFLSAPGRSLKAAPELLCGAMGSGLIAGLLVGVDVGETEDPEEGWDGTNEELAELGGGGEDAAFAEEKRDEAEGEEDKSRGSRAHSRGTAYETRDDADWEDEPGEEDVQEDEDEGAALERLLARIASLGEEKDELAAQNADLQRKVTVLIAREKALLQGQSRTGTAPEETQKEEEAPKEEHVQEKEKQLTETLLHIVDARKKASQQQLEYDQLALDLQTRLDDREFKVCLLYEAP